MHDKISNKKLNIKTGARLDPAIQRLLAYNSTN